MASTVATALIGEQGRPPDLRVWRGEGESRYTEVKRWVPLIEESVTPLGRGPSVASGSVVAGGDVSVFDASLRGRSTGISVVDPAYLAFAVPVSHDGEYVLNGTNISTTGIYMLVRSTPLYVLGGNRRTVGVLLPEKRLVDTVAALTGVSEDSVQLRSGLLTLPTAAAQSTRDRLLAIQAMSSARRTSMTGRQLAEEVLATVVDAFLRAEPISDATSGRSARMAGTVRRAEDRFMAAEGARVSLADLCQAAGVGSTALYQAFEGLCGESPLAYLRKRQLTRARLALMRSDREHGAVKRAALDAGLTHLGRFSAEYRELFGESPSTTLSKIRN